MKIVLLAVALLTSPLVAQISEGDAQWAARAEGHERGRAKPARIDAAITAYRRAVDANPGALEAHWKLLRALRFKGAYVAATVEQKKAIYSEAKTAGDAALKQLERLLAINKKTEKQIADAARTIPGAGEVFLWDAINWGEWALAYGKMAAAKQGAADRIKRGATVALLIDPRLEGGTPARVLGRLHDQTPRVPFITGWASGREALRYLNDSMKIDPTSKITLVFLAEAMVSVDPSTKPRAIALLRRAMTEPNTPEYIVEQLAAEEEARALLRKWGG